MGCIWSSVCPRVAKIPPCSDEIVSVDSSEGDISPESSMLLQDLEYGEQTSVI